MSSERPPVVDPSEHTEARKAVAEAVLTTPGVTRLEPTLRQAVQQLALLKRLRGERDEPDWQLIELFPGESGVSARVDIGVDYSRTFVDVGTEVRTRIRRALADNGLEVGRVDVAILNVRD